MAQKVPQKKDFDKALERAKYSSWSKKVVMLLSFLTAAISILPLEAEMLNSFLDVVAVIATMIMSYFSKRADFAYRKAEDTRRDGLIDCAFGTKIADMESDGYYDTDDVKYGIGKLLSNIHENSICSAQVIEQMLKQQEPKLVVSTIIILIILFVNFMGTRFVVVLVDIFLSSEYVSAYMKLKRLEQDCRAVQEGCKDIWQQYENAEHRFDLALIGKAIRVVLQYETAVSYASMMLDTKAYAKIRSAAEREWDDIKMRYQMNR